MAGQRQGPSSASRTAWPSMAGAASTSPTSRTTASARSTSPPAPSPPSPAPARRAAPATAALPLGPNWTALTAAPSGTAASILPTPTTTASGCALLPGELTAETQRTRRFFGQGGGGDGWNGSVEDRDRQQ